MNPNRLAGTILVAPVINYWWSGFPANVSNEAFKWKPSQDHWALSVAHYTPWLIYWWNTQKQFPASSIIAHNPDILSPNDKNLFLSSHFGMSIWFRLDNKGDDDRVVSPKLQRYIAEKLPWIR
ncbi:uncharacterized protein LOC120091819 [Benincasa hispida]|uniref:uncharacterized protein LOC120091819 n=1 Tax=Benincasa hispida TaxID=102211 RepID=UPI001901D31A|nr:uncharacterized protein LOC120091819 [Benincasa hispida]XP_038905889.1 uncharacterized protein LOC120091819 [Benincasa hispida]